MSEAVPPTPAPITDADRANLAQLAAMCADPSAGVEIGRAHV